MTAANRFANLPELLLIFGGQITNRKLLRNLCLASKSFHQVFSEALFRNVEITVTDRRSISILQSLSEAPSIRFARNFSCSLDKKSTFETPRALQWDVGELTRKMLKKTPLLTSFEWDGFPLATETSRTLHASCPNLSSLSISYPEMTSSYLRAVSPAFMPELNPYREELEDERAATVAAYQDQDLTAFVNLASLTLHELDDRLDLWQRQIATILHRSPALHTLRLSLSAEAVDHLFNTGDTYAEFLDGLGTAFAATGSPPLRLRTLHLGTSVWLRQGRASARAFAALVDTSILEFVHVENIIVEFGGDYLGGPISHDFAPFGPTRCPRLRVFSAALLDEEAAAFLRGAEAEDPSWAARLRVRFREATDYLRVEDVWPRSTTPEGDPPPHR